MDADQEVTTLINVPTAGTPETDQSRGECAMAGYGEACEAEGTSRAVDIREHMKRKIERHRRRQRATPGDGSPES